MATITEIPFRRIPRQSALFLEYLEHSPAALRYYHWAPTFENIEAAAEDVKSLQFKRRTIASILHRQNLSFGCDARTLDEINELAKLDCVAVLTGQQVGLFANPLYTIYKALTAIRLSEELNKRGTRAVPIFWMDTEDHDLSEVTCRAVLGADSSLQTIDFRQFFFNDSPAGSVGPMQFQEEIREVVEEYLRHIPGGPWKAEAKFQLESTYRPGSTFGQSFAELLCTILRGSGLILFDPHDAEAKRLAAPVFQTALGNADAFRSALQQRNQELADSEFHSQVSVLENSTVLFFTEKGERRALEKRDQGFGLKNTDRTFSFDEVLACALQTPERFSPNVLLRPLVQDCLFPTVAYVGGSAELAYFAQIAVLYGFYHRPMPVIWPRDSFTLIEPEVAAEFGRLGIDFQDCFQKSASLAEQALRNAGFPRASASLDELQSRLDQVLMEIKPELQTADPTLADSLETARRKILHNIQRLKSRVVRFQGTHNSSISSAVDRVLNHCYPNQTLQERELGIQHFFARHGPPLLDALRAAIDFESFSHHVIHL
jgi:bacillithiol biosynthesis cysteine-adding enzyme BshC